MAPATTTAGAPEGIGPRRLNRDHVIERICRWVELYGEPPRLADWNPAQARATGALWRVERYRAGDPETGEPWPSANAARRRFGGSLDAAIEAAGFAPARRGPRAARPVPAPARADLLAAARRDAARLAARLERAEAMIAALREELGTGCAAGAPARERAPSGAPPAVGPAGPAVLADALRALAHARATGGGGGPAVQAALTAVAMAALAWRERLG